MSEDEKLNPDKVEPKEFNKDQLGIPSNLRGPTPIKGKLDVEQLIFKQIERTAQSAIQDESLFAANVRLLMSMLPQYKRDELKNMSAEYTSTSQNYQYKYFCGVPLGTPDHPINGSPFLNEEENIDWHLLFELIMNSYEDIGFTFKSDTRAIEVRDPDGALVLPTPTFEATDTPAAIEQAKAEKTRRRYDCKVCGKHIEHGTGKQIPDPRDPTGKTIITIHKDCIDVAKTIWGKKDTKEQTQSQQSIAKDPLDLES